MGVPKFYRWISERYPNISRLITDNQIPDFDNFYLDMNGIIHACSHMNEDKCEVNISEEEIFRNIFHYIDFLFRMIKPKKVFVMAVDGVAPRAKMNQQRARRFRAGRDRMKKLKQIAEMSGQSLSHIVEQNFDTNSITPGTPFMAQLDKQLKYFIHVKLTTDPLWKNVDVHLSGHLTPGEGEHKIMEYIRYARSQPGYDINTRHCLYGLDADLIMLSLVTHEMHFSLLREEVKFGSKKISKIPTPEEINWQILHTCLIRDYIDLEFRSIRDKIKFPYDLERIIDDWILMGYLVGNDFIPHLPHFHINEEALSILWDTYKKVLPTLDGYMNECGELNLMRFEIYITELAKIDHQRYADQNDSFKHLEKLAAHDKNLSTTKNNSNKEDGEDEEDFGFGVLEKLREPIVVNTQKQDDKKENNAKIICEETKLADSMVSSSSSDDNDSSSDSDVSGETSDDNEKKSPSTVPKNAMIAEIDKLPLIEAEFRQHKNHYYRDKMGINLTSPEQLQVYVEQYIEALQWILKYYYQGCPSWSWFYPQHYAPYLSDLKNFKNFNIKFERGTPFKPFEQLLSVLPPSSSSLLPAALRPLMTDRGSPLLHFYPENFKLDQNEKKKDWEAIVLLPFINEELLLHTINKYYNQLNEDDKILNQISPSLCFNATSELNPTGNSLKTNLYFPPLNETRATCREFSADYYRSDDVKIKYGRFEEKDMVIFPKFPVLNVLPYQFDYKTNAVTVFETRSKDPTLVLNLMHRPESDCITYNDAWNPKDENTAPSFQITNAKLLVERYLGKRVFVNWPHFQYGLVCAITDFHNLYTSIDRPSTSQLFFQSNREEENQNYRNYIQSPIFVAEYPFEVSMDDNNKIVQFKIHRLNENQTRVEYEKALSINQYYENRKGISIGPIPILLYVAPLLGYRTKCSASSNKCQTMMCFSNQALAHPIQTTIFKILKYKFDSAQLPKTLDEHFKINDQIFSLKTPFYSSIGYVQQISQEREQKYMISCQMQSSNIMDHPSIHEYTDRLNSLHLQYFNAQDAAYQLNTAPFVISKITGRVNVVTKNQRRRAYPTNVGLSWKNNKPVKQLHGYTKKYLDVWYYSTDAIAVISEYIARFPEIISEILRKPNKDNYHESDIWTTENGKHQLQQVRIWIKSLPTYSMPLVDANWQMLDAPVIDEIENIVKSFKENRKAKTPTEKIKTVSFEPHFLFKSDLSLGVCEPDIQVEFMLYDRVVNVRADAGVPIGTRGTIISVMFGRTHLDTFYEVLFDTSHANTLDSILRGKHQPKCRINVHSYHLLNYSHSLRKRSAHRQQQYELPSRGVYTQHSFQRTTPRRFQSTQYGKNDSNIVDQRSTMPKSAPALPIYDRPTFDHRQQQKYMTDTRVSTGSFTEQPRQSFISIENPSSTPTRTTSTLNPYATFTPRNFTVPSGTVATPFSPDSNQNLLVFQNVNLQMSTQQEWPQVSSQYSVNPLIKDATAYMSQMSMPSDRSQFSAYPSQVFPNISPQLGSAPMTCNQFDPSFSPQSFDFYQQQVNYPYAFGPTAVSTPFYEQQRQQQQQQQFFRQNSGMNRVQIPSNLPLPNDTLTRQSQQNTSTGSTNTSSHQTMTSDNPT